MSNFKVNRTLEEMEQRYLDFAIRRTGVGLPNCFTYACARISENVSRATGKYTEVTLDPVDYRVGTAGELWDTHNPDFMQITGRPQPGDLGIFQGYGNWWPGHVMSVEIVGDQMMFTQSNYGGTLFECIQLPYTIGTVYPGTNLQLVGFLRHKSLVEERPKSTGRIPDQVLTVGSKVISIGLIVEKVDVKNDMIYNTPAGGWIPCKDLDEVDGNDGAKDQVLHVGSGVAFHGEMTVGQVDVAKDSVYINELGYWIKSRVLNEVRD